MAASGIFQVIQYNLPDNFEILSSGMICNDFCDFDFNTLQIL